MQKFQKDLFQSVSADGLTNKALNVYIDIKTDKVILSSHYFQLVNLGDKLKK